jgi:hypothetical protein
LRDKIGFYGVKKRYGVGREIFIVEALLALYYNSRPNKRMQVTVVLEIVSKSDPTKM